MFRRSSTIDCCSLYRWKRDPRDPVGTFCGPMLYSSAFVEPLRDKISAQLIIRPQRRRAHRNLTHQHIGCMSQPQHTELLGLSLQQLKEVGERLGQASYRARQLLDGLYRQRWTGVEEFTTLPSAFRQQLTESGYGVGFPQIEKKFVSADGTIRYLLAFSDGQSVETVWMPEGDGGEAGDGSAVGDAELQGLSHP